MRWLLITNARCVKPSGGITMPRYPLNPVTVGLSLGLAGALLALGSYRSAAEADVQRVEDQRVSQTNVLVEYIEPSWADRNRPGGRRDGGASRGGPCAPITGQPNLTALVPTTLQRFEPEETQFDTESDSPLSTYTSVLTFTTDPQPLLWFYFPYEQSELFTLELILQDEGGNTLEQTNFVPTEQGPGIVQIPLSTEISLTEGEQYQWYLYAHCAASQPEDPPVYAKGWIKRVPPPAALESLPPRASERQRAALYGTNGIWQDALTIVAERYREQPQDPEARADWVSLLSSIDFEPSTLSTLVAAPWLKVGSAAEVDR
ncbi:hypothetical protein C7293_02910 [filamentous cyanobacterium CCT1]|nr:hypothetical protein C7293_02910 [filamentous cyanobacterium CCT1]PSN77900.1 hypothetical protein C8B47_19685 [filamentous cyanobacterium CCP4]